MAKTPVEPTLTIPTPRVQVLERSLQSPFGIPSSPIELKEPGFVTHWCNTELKGGAQLHYFTEHGYLKVKPEYLRDKDTFQFTVSPEGFVTRGERHKEILMYTTVSHAQSRQRKKTEENVRRMRSVNEDVVEAAGKKLGDEAADFLNRQTRPVGRVTDSREVIEVQEGGE